MDKKNSLINLGCRLNIYEGEIIKNHLSNNNIKNITVINSCAVTAEAEKKVAYEIRKAKRTNPENKIIVTGCAAQIDPKKYHTLKEVDLVLGNKEKLLSDVWSNLNFSKPIQVDNILSEKKTVPSTIEKFDGKSRAYIEIQQGCDHRCTFCIIPYGRGNNRSVPAGEIVERIKKIVKNGYKEVVLTGVDITDYGKDLPAQPTFSNLIKRIIKLVPDLEQLRLSSIDCAEIDNLFDEIIVNPRVMPHLHLSLQSGDNMILKRMKRRHNVEQIKKLLKSIRNISDRVTFGADFICGFPTETEEMFLNTCKLVEELEISHLHVFPYSAKAGTTAAKMPQVQLEKRRTRAKILREIGNKNYQTLLHRQINKRHKVLIETTDGFGKTENNIKVKISHAKKGEVIEVIPNFIKRDYLTIN